MPLSVIRNDITKMYVDAIVNAANTGLIMGGGVCGAIFTAAGIDKLQKACDKLAPVKTGQAVITKGYALPAKYIIHTAGPVYEGGTQNEESLLRSCYKNALDIARDNGCKSIAFPLISSGIYGYPKDEALTVATDTISEWLMNNDMDVSLVVFDKTAFEVSNDLIGEIKAFIDENYVDESYLLYSDSRTGRFDEFKSLSVEEAPMVTAMSAPAYTPKPVESPKPVKSPKHGIDNVVERLDEPFSVTLLRLIDAKGKTDVEVYKRANLDRKLFSKIRTGKKYMPGKRTVIALAIALELTLAETRDLLERAGFALSRSVVFDVIIEYFISNRKYDIFEINNVLFEYDQQLLGGYG